MTTNNTSDPLVGSLLDGRYEIKAKLARGGMATVYRAQDRRLPRLVAIKVMHDGLGDDVEFARKFDREARAAAALTNPHVVSVFDQGSDAGRPFIVMEYVEGFTLRGVIAREAPLDPLRALDLLEPVVKALASAHEAGLVHRDVKPENVLISDRGQIKVADFGLARNITAQTATATAGMLMGTVSYLAPELVTTGHTDSRGDVYATGVVLFEMLTGKKPHTGDVPIAVAYSHVHNDIPAPSSLLLNTGRPLPEYLDALVLAATRRTPAERPSDARELLGLLRKVRKAMAAGVDDDPALTAEVMASVVYGSAHRFVSGEPMSPNSPVRPQPEANPALRLQQPPSASLGSGSLGSGSLGDAAQVLPPAPTYPRGSTPRTPTSPRSPQSASSRSWTSPSTPVSPRSPQTASSPRTWPAADPRQRVGTALIEQPVRQKAKAAHTSPAPPQVHQTPYVQRGARSQRRSSRRRANAMVAAFFLLVLMIFTLIMHNMWAAAQHASTPPTTGVSVKSPQVSQPQTGAATGPRA